MKNALSENQMPATHVKLSFRRHLLPPLLGIVMTIGIIGLANMHLLIAKISALTYEPPAEVSILVQATEKDSEVSKDPKIIIHNIEVEAPVVYGLQTVEEKEFQYALRSGVVHYPNTALPGESGNVVLFGHSSGPLWAPGSYKFVFTNLEKLEADNKIFIEYEGIRYTYTVSDKKVVPPTDMSVLNPTAKNTLTLITCTPVGSNKDRLIITAEQTSPVPAAAEESTPSPSLMTEIHTLPGAATPSLWESLRSRF